MRITKGLRFRFTYADSNPLWEVVKRVRTGVYDCKILNEYGSDWAGTTRRFLAEDIKAALGVANWVQTREDAHESYYAGLEVGQVVHYHNGFGDFVRCEVVLVAATDELASVSELKVGDKALKAVALVGEWRRLNPYDYHYKGVQAGRVFKPNASNLYENPVAATARAHGDPHGKEPRDLEEVRDAS